MENIRVIKLGHHGLDEDVAAEELTQETMLGIEAQFLRFRRESQDPILLDFGYVRGGDLVRAIRFADIIMENKVRTISRARKNSFVGSSGVIIYLAPLVREAEEERVDDSEVSVKDPIRFLIHQMWMKIHGSDVDRSGRLPPQATRKINYVKDEMRRILNERTALRSEEIDLILNQKGEAEFTLEQAVASKIVTKVISCTD